MFTEYALLILPEDLGLDVSANTRLFIELNQFCESLVEKGIKIHVPNVFEYIDKLGFKFDKLNVLCKPDEAVVARAGYTTSGTITYERLENIKREVLKKDPYVKQDSIEAAFYKAKPRTQKVIRKALKEYNMVIYVKSNKENFITVSEKALNESAMLVEINHHAKYKIMYGGSILNKDFLDKL